MNEIDFITALGKLLRSGSLRDAFAVNPVAVLEGLAVETSARPMLLAIPPADLEFQATVLLRKRFDQLRRYIPETLVRLREQGWQLFQQYGRTCWPEVDIVDAEGFCNYCRQAQFGTVVQSELNRLRFALGKKRIALHFVRGIQIRSRLRFGLQLLIRTQTGRRHQWVFYPAL